jgi:alginate O-acetyltransferase complex protein AlgI
VGIAGSLVFYAWGNSDYILLMVGLVFFAYGAAWLLEKWRGRQQSLYVLWGGIILTVTLLVGFKLRTDAGYPLGLSYVTFQVIAYFVDVYKNPENQEKDILKFSFYLLLFPKLPVGPIVPYRQVKAQIADLKSTPQDMADGLRRFLKGFAKKVLIADTLATVVVPIFGLKSPTITPGFAWLVIISYSLQLYYDFSGYTDMAIGLGNMMGVRFMENFNLPYLSKSISEFWRRWHISLSTWFREIVFYPLERRRFKWYGQQINILIVFMLTGLWHGLTRNFLLWGVLHGSALVFESTGLGRKLRNLWTPLQHIYSLMIVLVGWVIFRSPTPDFAFDFLRRLAGDMNGIQILPFELTSPLPFIEPTFLIALAFGILLCLPWTDWFHRLFPSLDEDRLVLRLISDASLLFIFLVALASAASASYRPGIYGGF